MMTMKKKDMIRLPYSETCFVCGKDNEAGLHSRFYVEDGKVKVSLNAKGHHCGYANTVHGGVAAAVLDECMGWAAALAIGRMCYTGEMTIRYLKPLPADRPMTVCAEIVKANKRVSSAKGSIVDEAGVEYVRGEGRYIPLSDDQSQFVDDILIYAEGTEKPFINLCQCVSDDEITRP